MNNTEAERLARLVTAELVTDENDTMLRAAAIDPATILVIASLLTEIIKMAIACSASDEAAAKWLKNPGIVGRFRLRWLVGRSLKGELAKHSTAVRSAILRRLAGEDSRAIIAEVRGAKKGG